MGELQKIEEKVDKMSKLIARVLWLLEDDKSTNRVGLVHEVQRLGVDMESVKDDIKAIKEDKTNATKKWMVVASVIGGLLVKGWDLLVDFFKS